MIARGKIDKVKVINATAWSSGLARDYFKMVDKFKNDSDKTKRLEKHECKSCFYLRKQRIGGARITNSQCGICDIEMTFGSTRTQPICKSCAHENGLCVECGGDIEMKQRRKPYPFEEKTK